MGLVHPGYACNAVLRTGECLTSCTYASITDGGELYRDSIVGPLKNFMLFGDLEVLLRSSRDSFASEA